MMSGGLRQLLTRRRVLKLGVGLSAAVIAAGGGAVGWLLSDRPSAPGRTALSHTESDVVRALAEAYFPAGRGMPSFADVDVVSGADAYIANLLPLERRLIRALLTGLDQWPRATLSSTARFADWSVDERAAALRSLEDSDVAEKRLLGGLLRALVGMPYFEDERVLAAIGHTYGCGF